MPETLVRFLGEEDPLEKEMATHSSILARRIPWTRGAWRATVHGVARVRHDLETNHHHSMVSHSKCSTECVLWS